MSNSILKCFEALQRLKDGVPKIVKKGTAITKASVALEAGLDASYIKASRKQFALLIAAIEEANAEQFKEVNCYKLKIKELEEELQLYKNKLKEIVQELKNAFVREISLYEQIRVDRKLRLSRLKNEKNEGEEDGVIVF